MAVITGKRKTGNTTFHLSYLSNDTLPADSIEMSNIESSLVHCFIGVKLYDSGNNLIQATAGSFAIMIKSINSEKWETPKEPTIDATNTETISWECNTSAVQIIPTGLTGVDHWVAHLTCNKR